MFTTYYNLNFHYIFTCIRVIFILLNFTSCGFQPLYQTRGTQSIIGSFCYERLFNNENNPREAFFLNNELEKLFRRKREPKYLLKVDFTVNKDYILIQEDKVSYKREVQFVLSYYVFEFHTNKFLISSKITNVSSLESFEKEELLIKELTSLARDLKLRLLMLYS